MAQIQTFKNCSRHTPSDSFPWLLILMEKVGLSPAALPPLSVGCRQSSASLGTEDKLLQFYYVEALFLSHTHLISS